MSASKPRSVAATAIGGLLLLSLVVFGLPLLYKQSGERVGDIDLAAPGASLSVSGHAGDRLTLSGSITVATGHLQGTTQKSRARRAFQALVDSRLTLRVVPPDRREVVVTCQFLQGSLETTWYGDDMTLLEIFNDCEVPLAADGPHRVSAEVQWAPEVKLGRALLEVRREPAQ